MYTNPHVYIQNETVNANFLNTDAATNTLAIFSLSTATESMLNPLIAGTIGFSTNFPINYSDSAGQGFPVGCVGLERSIDAVSNPQRQWRVAISYTMATNSNNGTSVKLSARCMGRMTRPIAASLAATATEIFSGPTETTAGRKFRMSSWQSMASVFDEIWEVRVYGTTNDSPRVTFSDLNICFQIRDF